jgi:hypothetical protein
MGLDCLPDVQLIRHGAASLGPARLPARSKSTVTRIISVCL